MPTPDETREHDATRRTLLDTEAAAVDLLIRSADDLGRDPATASEEFARRTEQVLFAARKAARSRSRKRLEAELGMTTREALRFGLRPLGPLPLLPRPSSSDVLVASDWARSMAETFRKRAEDTSVGSAAARARKRLEQAAQATVADAWGDERERLLRAAAREHEGADVLPAIARRWDAHLDACPVCHRLDGTIRPIGIDFPGGAVAGSVHHGCRCFSHILFAPIYLGRRQVA